MRGPHRARRRRVLHAAHSSRAAHGSPVWQRKLTGSAVLKSAKSNRLLLYRSTATDGERVAVSGMVAVPKGKAPKGGWPVITWAHGTDRHRRPCAPITRRRARRLRPSRC